MADNDTRYDLEARSDPLSLPDAPRTEGGPASRALELPEEPDTTRPRRLGETPASDLAPGTPEQSAESQPEALSPPDEKPWHAAIAEALTQPETTEAAPANELAEQQPPQAVAEPTADKATWDEAAAPAPEPTLGEPAAPSHEEAVATAFTDAAEGLFRPPASGPGDETHLVTLGRRLDPSLRIPRPTAPVIEPKTETAVKPTWKSRLYTIARYAGLAVAGYLALVLVLIVLFRFVNPPGSMLMLTQLLTGTSIDRTWASFDEISPALVRAVIVSEDGRFCEHGGIDTQAMKEAIERAAGGAPRGASTISMQVTKNLFLWNAKSYLRKVIEIPLTLIMELLWPKQRVLEVYLNIAEWGPGVFGAEAAARHHFNKSAARLDEREAALLAAVLPNPIVRVAGAPGSQTSRKARVIQSRVKAYGAVASCVVAPSSAATPATAKTPNIRKPQPLRAQPRRTPPPKKKVDDWAPILNFGN
ncbi:monofunctional biosynthetic peptidoglycan transglycosylase [Hyphomicrobium sp. LHD-15]|uniref:monofunctional biosynthetic peptidoglycan transglycosylase n=1 Tax=Hyphomicrobium sp. LHD-15 TaxID=3072142 RepID=UPI00280F180D|nr:monofunctional biosynthetic peptidoglycan transglycosylase [Hyphomicrobium sp. LHD-15]MDQ8698795.1 monofunctional biosynthetic peptidoglycan transglycosylase [Hyphomicrobium sp. LHD-15]